MNDYENDRDVFDLNAYMLDYEVRYGNSHKENVDDDEFLRDYMLRDEFVARYKDVIDRFAKEECSSAPKRSIKLPNESLDIIFQMIRNASSHYDLFKLWYWGYNYTILPYLDLSEYDFKDGYDGANLKGHPEIVTAAVAKKTGKKQLFKLRSNLRGVNLNGLDLSEEENVKLNEVSYVDFRNTNLKVSGGISNKYAWDYDYINFEGVDLSDVTFQGRYYRSNFRNTGAKIDLYCTPSLCSLPPNMSLEEAMGYSTQHIEGTDFRGCEIIDLKNGQFPTKEQLEHLRRMCIVPYRGTAIEFEGKIYVGTEEIHSLVKEVERRVIRGEKEKESEKTYQKLFNNDRK